MIRLLGVEPVLTTELAPLSKTLVEIFDAVANCSTLSAKLPLDALPLKVTLAVFSSDEVAVKPPKMVVVFIVAKAERKLLKAD